MTCGLDHTRWPLPGHPQHGRLAFLPARVLANGENWDADEPHLYCEGEITQWRHGAEALRLVRRIEAPIGGQTLRIRDRVENIGFAEQRHALLYHINLGYPCVAPGATVALCGETIFGPLTVPDDRSPTTHSFAVGERDGLCTLTSGERIVTLSFSRHTLPHLQLWHDPRPNAYVLAIEPCTSARPPDGSSSTEPTLSSGERRDYMLDLTFSERV